MTDDGPFQPGYKEAVPGVDYWPYTPPRTAFDRAERIRNAVGDALAAAAPGNTRDPMEYAPLFPNRPAERLLEETRPDRAQAHFDSLNPEKQARVLESRRQRAEEQAQTLERNRGLEL